MNDEELTEDEFIRNGISQDTSIEERNMFDTIQKLVLDHVAKGGHDYSPDPLEYRASSIGTCSRKILLEKNLGQYLDEKDMLQLPMWYQEQLVDKEDHLDFGAHVAGQVIHETIQDALQGTLLSMEEEVSIQVGNATLKGHYDLLMELDNGEKIVIDIKSTKSPRKYLPNHKHLRQLMAYQAMLGGIRGALLYVDRDSFRMTYVSQAFDKEKFSRLTVKLTQLAQYEENEQLPPPIPEFDYECQSISWQCQFYEFCFPNNSEDELPDIADTID